MSILTGKLEKPPLSFVSRVGDTVVYKGQEYSIVTEVATDRVKEFGVIPSGRVLTKASGRTITVRRTLN